MDHPAVADPPRRVEREELRAGSDVRVVVRDLRDMPDLPRTVTTPDGPRSPARPLREWRALLAEQGGMKDPWGNVHPVDLSAWDDADPETPLIVAVLAKRS